MFKRFKKDREGFTLAELLIVVAIIAILVAISIPIFKGKLDKAREATNIANLRSAKATAVADYLTLEKTAEEFYIYDVKKGAVTTGNVSAIYGSTPKHITNEQVDAKGVKNGVYQYMKVDVSKDGTKVVTYPTETVIKERNK